MFGAISEVIMSILIFKNQSVILDWIANKVDLSCGIHVSDFMCNPIILIIEAIAVILLLDGSFTLYRHLCGGCDHPQF